MRNIYAFFALLGTALLMMMAPTAANATVKISYQTFPVGGLYSDPFDGQMVLEADHVGNTWTLVSAAGMLAGKKVLGLSSYAGANNIMFGPQTSIVPSAAGIGLLLLGGETLTIWDSGFGEPLVLWTKSSLNPSGNKVFGLLGVGFGTVPEPSTWAFMILGFGAIGATLRRRATPARVVA